MAMRRATFRVCLVTAFAALLVYEGMLLVGVRHQAVYAGFLAAFLQPSFLVVTAVSGCIIALAAFAILRLRSPVACWIAAGALLAAYLLVSPQAMAFDLFVHDIYLVLSIRPFILWLLATLTAPLLWL